MVGLRQDTLPWIHHVEVEGWETIVDTNPLSRLMEDPLPITLVRP